MRIIEKAIIMFLCCGCSAQTLKRHTEPPQLNPESCRDHVSRQRDVMALVAHQQRDKMTRKAELRLVEELGDVNQVEQLCRDKHTLAKFDAIVALAEYERRVDIVGTEQ